MPQILGVSPLGSIITHGSVNLPKGYIICDGSALSRTTYAALFLLIGTAWGIGDGSTTFNIPDMRGQFLRGQDHGSGHDPDATSRSAYMSGGNTGDQIGSFQSHLIASHNHILSTVSGWGGNNGGNRPYWDSGDRGNGIAGAYTDTGDSGVGSETRPVNVYVNFLIKVA